MIREETSQRARRPTVHATTCGHRLCGAAHAAPRGQFINYVKRIKALLLRPVTLLTLVWVMLTSVTEKKANTSARRDVQRLSAVFDLE